MEKRHDYMWGPSRVGEGIEVRFWCRITLLAALLLVSACTKLGPEFTRPSVSVAEGWLEAGDPRVSSQAADYRDWWTAFDDPVLNSLIATAYRQNLPLQIAGFRIIEARAQLGIAVGNLFPQRQQARGGVGHVELSQNAPNALPFLDDSFRDLDLGLDAAWEIDLWGRFRRGVEAAGANVQASVANYDDALVTLTADVATAYALIRTFEERLKLAYENLEIQEESLRIAGVRFKYGATTELDVQQAKTLLLNTKAFIPTLDTGLRQAKNGLSILLGMPPSGLEETLGDPRMIPSAPAEIAVGIPAELLRRRPDIRRAELEAAAQSAQIGIAKAELYPQFSLTGSIGFRASDALGGRLADLFDGDSFTAFVGPSFRWNILNYGRIKNNVRAQDARLQQFIAAYQHTVLQAAREVEDALIGFLRAKEQARLLAESVYAARRAVDLALVQYRNGTADYTRVLNTQEALVSQQDTNTAARGDIARNLIAMYKALGGGWQIRHAGHDSPQTRDKADRPE